MQFIIDTHPHMCYLRIAPFDITYWVTVNNVLVSRGLISDLVQEGLAEVLTTDPPEMTHSLRMSRDTAVKFLPVEVIKYGVTKDELDKSE